jgi:multiple sugar transport system permease protein/raffinose/stachyose/melibiose transport system permease protein
MVLSAFKTRPEVESLTPTFLPRVWTLENISWAWDTMNFPRLFANSLIVSVSGTLLALYTSSLVGYVLEKYEFRGKNLLFIVILSQMFMPWQVGTIVRWFMFDRFGLRNTLAALIIPGIYSIFGIFMMRQHMHTVPNELLDAARVDGTSEIGIFHRIILPNVGSALSALGIFFFMWSYNDFFWPLIILNDPDLYTVPLGLAFYKGYYSNDNAKGLGGATIAVIPVLIVFLLLQRRIVEGVTMTGIGGH